MDTSKSPKSSLKLNPNIVKDLSNIFNKHQRELDSETKGWLRNEFTTEMNNQISITSPKPIEYPSSPVLNSKGPGFVLSPSKDIFLQSESLSKSPISDSIFNLKVGTNYQPRRFSMESCDGTIPQRMSSSIEGNKRKRPRRYSIQLSKPSSMLTGVPRRYTLSENKLDNPSKHPLRRFSVELSSNLNPLTQGMNKLNNGTFSVLGSTITPLTPESLSMDTLEILVPNRKVFIESYLPKNNNYEWGVNQCKKWGMNPYELSLDNLIGLILCMWDDMKFFEILKLRLDKTVNLLQCLQRSYNLNPYHSWLHAFDVMQTIYVFIIKSYNTISKILTIQQMLGLMLSALCHDVDHPGYNNAFQIATNSSLAIMYNDKNVLENHHSATAARLLRIQSNSILDILGNKGYREIRKIMIETILGTDMAEHFRIHTNFQIIIQSLQTRKLKYGIGDRETQEELSKERLALMTMMLKMADISNPAKPFDISKVWSDNLLQEWFNQGDTEREYQLPESQFMNRNKSNQAKLSKGFISFCVQEAFESLVKVLPELKFISELIIINYKKWDEMSKEE